MKRSTHIRRINLFLRSSLCTLVCIFSASCLFAATSATLTDEEKQRRRTQVSQYFDDEIQQAKTTSSERRQSEGAGHRLLRVTLGAHGGYDNNANLNTTRKGDGFHEETAALTYDLDPEGKPFLVGPSTFGFYANTNFRDYADFEGLDYHFTTGGFQVNRPVTDRISLDAAYDLNYVRYIRDNQLDYLSHRMEYGLSVQQSAAIKHRVFADIERPLYRHRMALTAGDLPSKLDRKDLRVISGYEIEWYPAETVLVGASVTGTRMDSNDLFHDYSDYSSVGAGAYLYAIVADPLAVYAHIGYEFMKYDGRTFTEDLADTERDNSFYTGGSIYYDVYERTQLVFSYLYIQNSSNDRALEYSGSTVSCGVEITL